MNEPLNSEPADAAASSPSSQSSSPMESGQPTKPQEKNSSSRAIMKKLGLIALIFGLLQAPLFLITGVIEERKTFNVDYPLEYRGPGAGAQTIVGPVLSIPYKYQTVEEKQVASSDETDDEVAAAGKKEKKKAPVQVIKVTRTATGVVHFFPENLSVIGNLAPEIRDEGKFKSILYSTALELKGTFNLEDLKKKKINEADLMWDDAFLAVGISDVRGISKQTTLDWAGKDYNFTPGTNGLRLFESGEFAALPGMSRGGTYPFHFTVNLRGSRDLNVFPAGKDNKIMLSSHWKHPTFTGGFLPSQKIGLNPGFQSTWEVNYFSRNLPQIWTSSDPEMNNSLAQYMVGVELATPVEFYQTTVRAVKYGSLFIVLTFLTFFMFEIIAQTRIHEVQYLLVGLALTIFFLLLIAISEWLPFVWAYVLASVPTIAQVTCYTQAFSKATNKSLWKVMALTLSVLYVYLYVLLQLENFSLLFGSVGLFLALSVVMYILRNFNWYGEETKSCQESV